MYVFSNSLWKEQKKIPHRKLLFVGFFEYLNYKLCCYQIIYVSVIHCSYKHNIHCPQVAQVLKLQQLFLSCKKAT